MNNSNSSLLGALALSIGGLKIIEAFSNELIIALNMVFFIGLIFLPYSFYKKRIEKILGRKKRVIRCFLISALALFCTNFLEKEIVELYSQKSAYFPLQEFLYFLDQGQGFFHKIFLGLKYITLAPIFMETLGLYREWRSINKYGHLYLGESAFRYTESTSVLNNCAYVQRSFFEDHQIIFGATGSGKTYAVLSPQIKESIKRGECVFVIDPKGDKSLLSYLKKCAYEFDRIQDLVVVNSEDIERSQSYNPLGHGDLEDKVEKIISSIVFQNEYYKIKAREILFEIFSKKEEITLSEVLHLIPDKNDYSGLRGFLYSFVNSKVNALMSNDSALSILDIYLGNKIFYFGINVNKSEELGVILCKILIADLKSFINHIEHHVRIDARRRVSVYIDEFGSFITDKFINFLNKCRSSGIRLVLATQSISDLTYLGEDLSQVVIDNINIKVLLAQSDPRTVDYFSKLSGTRNSDKLTAVVEDGGLRRSYTGMGSVREVQEYHVSPNEIRELYRFWAIIYVRSPYTIFKIKLVPKKSTYLKKFEREKKAEIKNREIKTKKKVKQNIKRREAEKEKIVETKVY